MRKETLRPLRNIYRGIVLKILQPLVRLLYPIIAKTLCLCYPEWQARQWSNTELRRWGPLFKGSIINVSGWEDKDKEGGCYVNYFPNRSSYLISNIGRARGWSDSGNEIFLDLSKDLPQHLKERFDVVFNHTTLEHIYDVRKAMANLCALSRDIVIVIVPFLQPLHWEPGSYGDYWRITPFALHSLFNENGFEIVYDSHNDNPVTNVYLFCIATRHPEKWRSTFPPRSKPASLMVTGMCWYRHRLPSQL
jgi:hypothetical protein